MKRLGVYCGSFSPIHNGHIEIITSVLNQDLVDEVLIIPTKEYWDKNNLIPLEDRIKMIELCNIKNLVVDKTHNDTQYTIDILKDLENKDIELYLILGADNLLKLDKWNSFEELIKYNFIIVPRIDIDIKDYMVKFNKENYSILDYKQNNISSSFIRDNVYTKEVESMMNEDALSYYRMLTKGALHERR